MILHALFAAACEVQAEIAEQATAHPSSVAVLRGEFVIVSVERVAHGRVTEIAALRVGAGLVQREEFTASFAQGCEAEVVLRQLAAFVNELPMFVHDMDSLMQYGLGLGKLLHDSQLLAWQVWPGLPSYRLADLAELLDLKCNATRHALAAAQITLALLCAVSQPTSSTYPQCNEFAQEEMAGNVVQSG